MVPEAVTLPSVPMSISHGPTNGAAKAMPSNSTAAAFKANVQMVAPEQHTMSEQDKKKLTSQLANLHGQASKVYVRLFSPAPF